MRLQLRDSYLRCPRCHEPLSVFALEEEGQQRVPHRCLSCGYSEMAPADPRPRRPASSWLRDLRDRAIP